MRRSVKAWAVMGPRMESPLYATGDTAGHAWAVFHKLTEAELWLESGRYELSRPVPVTITFDDGKPAPRKRRRAK